MSDDLGDRGPQDRKRIDVSQEYEVRYWTAKFAVSPEQLRAAVDKVGVMADDVERELTRATKH
jgi:hypothetical protein